MTNGFYKANDLSLKDKKLFLKEAIDLAYKISCESKYATKENGEGMYSYRIVDSRLSLKESIDFLLKDKNAKLDCIDRFAYNQGQIKKELCEFEIIYHTTNSFNNGWLLVYIIVNEKNFFHLVEKFNLKLTEW